MQKRRTFARLFYAPVRRTFTSILPIKSTWHSSLSPWFSEPTPCGVPVMMISPG